ncbi:MAG: DNA polymerase III subunit beta [Candidatus Portnoybacteria bacterium]
MDIICLQENLKQALNITERIIGRNLTLPILNNILLGVENNKLKISSTNLEIGVSAWVSGKIQKKGAITIPARLITDFVNNLPNKKIELKSNNNQLILKSEKFKATLNGLPADDYPIIPKIKNDPVVKIKGALLKNDLSQVVEMASISESRPEISGVYMKFEKDLIKLAATDSFRLAEKNIEISLNKGNEGQSVIIPQRTIQELIRILGERDLDNSNQEQEVEIVLSGNQILFDLGYAQLISRLIEGQYPDYQQVIPSKIITQVIINRGELIKSIKLASLFSGKVNDIKVVINPQKSFLEISSKNTDIGENKSQIKAEVEGNQTEVFFNYRYLLDGLNNIFSDKVIVALGDNEKTIIRPVGDINYTYVVMPIKI